jgi:hypothetical protein
MAALALGVRGRYPEFASRRRARIIDGETMSEV